MTTASEMNTQHLLEETARIREVDPELWEASEQTRMLINSLREDHDIQWNEDIGLGAQLYADFLMGTIGDMVEAAQDILLGIDTRGIPEDVTEDQIIDTARMLASPKLIKFLQVVQVGVMRSAADELAAAKVA